MAVFFKLTEDEDAADTASIFCREVSDEELPRFAQSPGSSELLCWEPVLEPGHHKFLPDSRWGAEKAIVHYWLQDLLPDDGNLNLEADFDFELVPPIPPVHEYSVDYSVLASQSPALRARSIHADGLIWGTSKFVEVAYGIKNLQMEDEKISVDWLEEQITGFENYVQSIDIVAFN